MPRLSEYHQELQKLSQSTAADSKRLISLLLLLLATEDEGKPCKVGNYKFCSRAVRPY